MAFNKKFLQPVGGSAGSGQIGTTDPGENVANVWIYGSPDSLGDVTTVAGYFNEVRDLVNRFDIILVSGSFNNLRWTSFLTVPKSPSTDDVVMSALRKDAA